MIHVFVTLGPPVQLVVLQVVGLVALDVLESKLERQELDPCADDLEVVERFLVNAKRSQSPPLLFRADFWSSAIVTEPTVMLWWRTRTSKIIRAEITPANSLQ